MTDQELKTPHTESEKLAKIASKPSLKYRIKRWALIGLIVLCAGIIAFLYVKINAKLGVRSLKQQVEKAYIQEDISLGKPLQTMGLDAASNKPVSVCVNQYKLWFSSGYKCNYTSLNSQAKKPVFIDSNGYKENADKVVKLLKDNGWSILPESNTNSNIDKLTDVQYVKESGKTRCLFKLYSIKDVSDKRYITSSMYSCELSDSVKDLNLAKRFNTSLD